MKGSQSSRRTALIGALTAGTVLGCAEVLPTAQVTGADSYAVRVALDDVRARVMPGLSSRTRALQPGLDALDAGLRSRDAAAVRAALTGAERVLASLDRDPAIDDAGDRADLSAVRLLLDQARLFAAAER